MLGGVRLAHTKWSLTAVQRATTDKTIPNPQGGEYQCHPIQPREPEEMYADNADRLSTAEQYVLFPGFRNDSGS